MVLPFALALASFVVADRLPVRPPTAVGMSAERLANIDRVIRRGVDAGGFPGASVVIGRRGAAVVQKGYGHTGWTSSAPSVDADRTIYDLASLTKVVGTTTALMVLYDEGRLDLDAPFAQQPDLADWKKIGVRAAGGGPLPSANLPASLVEAGTRTFLVYGNYEALLGYNCAHSYALSVGLLANSIK